MNVSTAKMILEDTFKSSFDMDNFEYFLVELFNISNIGARSTLNYVKKDFKDYIENFYDLGFYRGFYRILCC